MNIEIFSGLQSMHVEKDVQTKPMEADTERGIEAGDLAVSQETQEAECDTISRSSHGRWQSQMAAVEAGLGGA